MCANTVLCMAERAKQETPPAVVCLWHFPVSRDNTKFRRLQQLARNSLHAHWARFALWLLLFSAVNAFVPIALEIWDITFFFFNEPQQKRPSPSPHTPPPLLLQAEPPTPTPPARPSNDPSTCRPRPSVAALLCCLSLQAAQTPLADLPAIRDLRSEEKKLHPPAFCFVLFLPPPFPHLFFYLRGSGSSVATVALPHAITALD